MLLEDRALYTLPMGERGQLPATRTIKIYPTGVILFRYEVDCGEASVADLFAIKEYFRKSDKGGLAAYLREAYPQEAERSSASEFLSNYGIDIVNDMLLIRAAAQTKEVLAFRPRQAFGLLSRYALCVSPRPNDRAELERQLEELAHAKGLVYPGEDLWGGCPEPR